MDYHFLVIGCGGTGGNFLKEFARFLYMGIGTATARVTVFDGDIVEEKNIARQPFTQEDVGMNKAEALCQAIYEVFGLSFEYCNRYLLNKWELAEVCTDGRLPVLIGAVDNHAARKVMHEFFESRESCIYFDSANEFSCGELVTAARLDGHTVYPDRACYYPEILHESRSRAEMGCEELNRTAPQHIATNVFAASILLANTAMLIHEQKLRGGITYFDAFKGFSRFEDFSQPMEDSDEKKAIA